MPWAPTLTCRHCGGIYRRGTKCRPCETARKAPQQAARGKDPWFFMSRDWRQLRHRVLLEEPRCPGWPVGGPTARPCGALTTVVDHIFARRKFPDLALDRSNLRALCKSCHDRRTATEQGFASRATRYRWDG
jgi:5-methylcytosine-specific restriction enzyme A